MKHDPINNPKWYAANRKYEPIDVIEDWNLGYHFGNAIKYISRAGRKNKDIITDTKKAMWYLKRYIEMLEKKNDNKTKNI